MQVNIFLNNCNLHAILLHFKRLIFKAPTKTNDISVIRCYCYAKVHSNIENQSAAKTLFPSITMQIINDVDVVHKMLHIGGKWNIIFIFTFFFCQKCTQLCFCVLYWIMLNMLICIILWCIGFIACATVDQHTFTRSVPYNYVYFQNTPVNNKSAISG